MFSKPGSPCNNYQGYCDVFQKCREVDPSGPLATLRKLLLSEESIANLKRFLMRYWYTVIFIVLAVFILMAVIIKICGKKTPLVRSRRKRRRHTNTQQEVEGIDNPDNVQVHPTAVEAAVPLGKKVRKGQSKDRSSKKRSKSRGRSGGRKVSKSQDRSPPTSTTNTTPTSSNNHEAATVNIEAGGHTVEDGVARAVRLAANLSNQLFVDLPPEATASASNNVSTRASVEPPPRYEDVIVEPRKSRTKAKKATKVRKHKSLSPEKRLATTLAQSMSSISKSFEKLDLVGRGRGRPLNSEQQPSGSGGGHKKRRRSRQQQNQEPSKQKEVTIAKLGRFKFSVEVAKQFDEELSKSKGQKRATEKASESSKPRKISSSNKTKPKTSENSAENSSSKNLNRKESSVAKLPSIHVTNFNAQKEVNSAQLPFNAPSVIVSKKRKERPRRQNSQSPEKSSKNSGVPGLDYRRSFGGCSASEKFSRSISVPGPAPNLEEIQEHGQQPPRLRRSETMVQKAYEHQQPQLASASSHSWVAEFDNHAYAKSPCNEQKEAENSLSLTSLSNEEETNANNVSFHCSSSSTDSDLEVVTNKPPPISRAKILETVGVIVPSTASVAASNSAANLLLPPSSSPTSASSGATSPSIASSGGLPDEPRLAFIGCETTASTLSSPLSGGSAASSNKRPSLSERYPTSPSSASTGSTASTGSSKRDHEEEDLDIISIMTDGMT